MCRLLLVFSPNILSLSDIKKFLWFYNHSIFKQCYKDPHTPLDENNSRNHTINLDGYGLGFYNGSTPHIYTNIIPSWNDINLFQIIHFITTYLLMVHIRATDPLVENNFQFVDNLNLSPVHTYNCHPFSYNEYLFCHNGVIQEFYNGHGRKLIINAIDDDLLVRIMGNTDSEYLFFLILTFIKQNFNIIDSITQTINFINNLNHNSIFSMNIILTDGITIFAIRYINQPDQSPPSLYLCQSDNKFFISSEPINKHDHTMQWSLVQRNSLVSINVNNFSLHQVSLQ